MPTPKPYRKQDGSTVWRVRFRIGGRGTRETTETFDTEREAKSFARDVKDEGGAGAIRRLEDSLDRRDELTLDQVADAFLAWKADWVRSDRTIIDYRRDHRLWISPTFGGRPAAHISPADVQGWVNAMMAGKLNGAKPAAKSIHDRHALLHAMLNWAVKNGHVDANPCSGTDLPKKRKGMPKGMRPAEWTALRAAIQQINPDAAELCVFLLASAWRWSEAIALTTYDVEDDGERIWVTMTHVHRRTATGSRDVEDGKGDASLRRVELDSATAALVRHRVATAPPGGRIFTKPSGAPWHYSNFRRDVWDPAVAAANLQRRPTPHWLRHTAVVGLALSGASLPELQARIGHANIQTTIDTYGRLITDVQPEVLERYAAMMGLAAPALTPPGQAQALGR